MNMQVEDSDGQAVIEKQRVPGKGSYTEAARRDRLDFLQQRSGVSMEGVGNCSYEAEELKNNIESLVGTVEVPVGVVGPLKVDGAYMRDTVYMPCATTEGALVASMNRGAKAITSAGGANAWATSQRMLRVPSFEFAHLSAARRFVQWLSDHEDEIRREALKKSKHAQLAAIESTVIGRCVHVLFEYQCGDASGQNMVTTCTWSACKWIREALVDSGDMPLLHYAIETGLSGDKRVTGLTFTRGRGIRVTAECSLPADVVRKVLKVEPADLYKFFRLLATAETAAGGVGCHYNVSNALAGIFTATGQDIACVHESAGAMVFMELQPRGDLYVSITLPSLVVGTVGGGTGLQQQREWLQQLGCAGSGKVMRFAECIAACCMGLELSTMAALTSDDYAHAHERMGRNRPA